MDAASQLTMAVNGKVQAGMDAVWSAILGAKGSVTVVLSEVANLGGLRKMAMELKAALESIGVSVSSLDALTETGKGKSELTLKCGKARNLRLVLCGAIYCLSISRLVRGNWPGQFTVEGSKGKLRRHYQLSGVQRLCFGAGVDGRLIPMSAKASFEAFMPLAAEVSAAISEAVKMTKAEPKVETKAIKAETKTKAKAKAEPVTVESVTVNPVGDSFLAEQQEAAAGK